MIPAAADNTIYNHPTVDLSNGGGNFLHVGVTPGGAAGMVRRALIRFDLSLIPAGSTVESCRLDMYCSVVRTGDTVARTASLHRLTDRWGEGTSGCCGSGSGTGSGEGGGSLPTAGDATWRHREYDTLLWAALGGDYAAASSAGADIAAAGPVTWASTAGLVADAQMWVDDPTANHGWILIGDETEPLGSGRRFDSRTNPSAANRPSLTVTYVPPPASAAAVESARRDPSR
ncbi:MAG: DNRLRE domain-containing protein [Candidatus Eiseniibacteriota bacterium]